MMKINVNAAISKNSHTSALSKFLGAALVVEGVYDPEIAEGSGMPGGSTILGKRLCCKISG